jgi:lysylphosphatidylglycerol synthetase-like protein (DUF2156 family)
LSNRERRVLRRLEDAAVADDPLLHMRLGLPLTPLARTIVKTRRSAKSIGRWLTCRSGWWLLALFVVVFTLVCAFAQSFAWASIVASPCAFALGAVLARRRVDRPDRLVVEHPRHLDQST